MYYILKYHFCLDHQAFDTRLYPATSIFKWQHYYEPNIHTKLLLDLDFLPIKDSYLVCRLPRQWSR